MSAENICAALLNVPALQEIVSTRIALVEAPQGSGFPAIAYSVVSDTPEERMCQRSNDFTARVQINPLAASMIQVQTLHSLIQEALQVTAPLVVGDSLVLACNFAGYGPISKDDFSGMWTKPADFMLIYRTPNL